MTDSAADPFGLAIIVGAPRASPDDPERLNAANRYLSFAQTRTGVSHAYLIDTQGLTRAASNWQGADSFVASNYGFRPYFQDAMTGKTGVFYGIGVTTGQPGVHCSADSSGQAGAGRGGRQD